MGISTIQPSAVRISRIREAIVLLISLACIFLFLSSAYGKVMEHERFVHGLSRVAFIGLLAPVIGWVVPIAEILIANLLIIPKTSRIGLYAFTVLMAVFTIYIGGMMIWADKLPCNCNLLIEKLSWGQHLVFNFGCITLSLTALGLSKSIKS